MRPLFLLLVVACAKPALRTSTHPTPKPDSHALRLTFETASRFSAGWLTNDPRFLCLYGAQISDSSFAIDSLAPSDIASCDGLGVAYVTHRRTSFEEELVLMRALAQAKTSFTISIAVVGVSTEARAGQRSLVPQFFLVMKVAPTRRVFAQT